MEIAYAITSSRIPPTLKRGLGFARSCREVEVRLEKVAADRVRL